MDQATPTGKKNWHIGSCCQNTDMDYNLRLCAGCHHEKALDAWTELLHNFTDYEYYSFPKIPYFMGIQG